MWTQPAAFVFCTVMALLGVFQLALAAGAPLGRFAWGGGHERLPLGYRIGSVISIALYAAFAIIVLERAGLGALLPSPDIAGIGIWVVTGYMGLGILMNAISRSLPERLVMTPVVIVLFATSLAVALQL
jgi:hypothetical protein